VVKALVLTEPINSRMVGNSETIKKRALLGCVIFEAYLDVRISL
jgi:hypothetical protein